MIPNPSGLPVNLPEQPVVRVPWTKAMEFCRWLSARTGRRVSLPTEAQWERACCCGSAEAMWYGDIRESPGARIVTPPDPLGLRVAGHL